MSARAFGMRLTYAGLCPCMESSLDCFIEVVLLHTSHGTAQSTAQPLKIIARFRTHSLTRQNLTVVTTMYQMAASHAGMPSSTRLLLQEHTQPHYKPCDDTSKHTTKNAAAFCSTQQIQQQNPHLHSESVHSLPPAQVIQSCLQR